MKGWRPAGWDKELKHRKALNMCGAMDAHFQPATPNEERYYTGGYEDGADALLKALCTDENRLDCIDQFDKKHIHKWGWLVYIPDRKEEG